MILNEEIIDKIKRIAKPAVLDSKGDSFFVNGLEKFSDKDKAKIMSIFVQTNKSNFYHYVNNSNLEIKNKIIDCCTAGINDFFETDDNKESNLYFDLINLYLNINSVEFKNDIFDKIMSKFNKMLSENSIYNNKAITELLTNYIKFIAYRNDNSDEINTIIKSQSFSVFEKIITAYIDKLKIDENILNNDLLMLLLEVRKLSSFAQINEQLIKKDNIGNLCSFTESIKNNTPINSSEFNEYCKSIIMYKLSNSILPKEHCLYIHKYYSENKQLIRIANVDLVQNYLIENGVNDVIVFNDPLLWFPGIAGTKYMALRRNYLNLALFHEATHIIQKHNALNNKNFTGYRYDLLKDFIVQKNISWNDYNEINHDKFLFEIDADIQGAKQCGMVMLAIEQSISQVEQEMLSLDELEQKRINESKTIVINGTEIDKKDLFDSIILQNPDYIKIFPVLSIEYKEDGSKKNTDEILRTLKNYRLNHTYTDEEISAIEICIFGKSLENKKPIKY